MRICLDEIARCQKTTPRPNFIVLLGDRYSWCPLPTEIPAQEFEEIERRVWMPITKRCLRSGISVMPTRCPRSTVYNRGQERLRTSPRGRRSRGIRVRS